MKRKADVLIPLRELKDAMEKKFGSSDPPYSYYSKLGGFGLDVDNLLYQLFRRGKGITYSPSNREFAKFLTFTLDRNIHEIIRTRRVSKGLPISDDLYRKEWELVRLIKKDKKKEEEEKRLEKMITEEEVQQTVGSLNEKIRFTGLPLIVKII